MRKPFFSIIIPVYNRGSLIENTIKTTLGQTFTDFEIIVIDDGSKDNTAEVVQRIKDERLKYYYQENAERCVARNNGIKYSQGEYLIFLDSDDFFDVTYLEELYRFILQLDDQKCLIISHARMVYITSEGVKKIEPDYNPIETGKELEYFLFHPIATSRMCLHRQAAEEFKFDPDVLIVEDQVLTLSVATKYKVYQFKKYLVNYSIHGDNSVDLSKNPYIKRLQGLRKLFYNPQYAYVQKLVKKKDRNFVLAQCYFNISRAHLSNHEKWKSIIPLLMSIYYKINYRNKERLHMLLLQW
ncbi:MAG: glycosyltransferase family 2 protein [Flavobacteriales bacterium]